MFREFVLDPQERDYHRFLHLLKDGTIEDHYIRHLCISLPGHTGATASGHTGATASGQRPLRTVPRSRQDREEQLLCGRLPYRSVHTGAGHTSPAAAVRATTAGWNETAQVEEQFIPSSRLYPGRSQGNRGGLHHCGPRRIWQDAGGPLEHPSRSSLPIDTNDRRLYADQASHRFCCRTPLQCFGLVRPSNALP